MTVNRWNRWIAIFFLLGLFSCDKDYVNPFLKDLEIKLKPHNSEGLIYKDVSITAYVGGLQNHYNTPEWGIEGSNFKYIEFLFALRNEQEQLLTARGIGTIVNGGGDYGFNLSKQMQTDYSPHIMRIQYEQIPRTAWINELGGLSLIYQYSSGTLRIASFNAQFDLIVDKELNFLYSSSEFKWHTDESGYLFLAESNRVYKLNHNGDILYSKWFDYALGTFKMYDFRIFQNSLQVIRKAQQLVILSEVDLTNDMQVNKTLTLPVITADITAINFSEEANIAVLAKSENNSSRLVHQDSDGNIYFDKTYTGFKPGAMQFSESGWIIYSIYEAPLIRFTKVDLSGEVEWDIANTQIPGDPLSYPAKQQIQVISKDGIDYLICDNYKVIKVSASGDILWSKFYMPNESHIRNAVLSDNGDLYLVGSTDIRLKNGQSDFQDYDREMVFLRVDSELGLIDTDF